MWWKFYHSLPWNDRRGRFSGIRFTAFLAILMPGAWLAFEALAGRLGPRPLTTAIHDSGLWAIRFLFLSLSVTPLRRVLDWRQPALIRRMLGLAALAYAAGHFVLYVADQRWDWLRAATEIAVRLYLAIGAFGLVGLIVLGATSTDAAIRRLGHRWTLIHKVSYVIALLTVFHFFLQAKINSAEATMMAGFLCLLLAYRVFHGTGSKHVSPGQAGLAALTAALLTAAIEYAWISQATGLSGNRILKAHLDFPAMVRPAYWVLFSGLAIALLAWALPRIRIKPTRPGEAPPYTLR